LFGIAFLSEVYCDTFFPRVTANAGQSEQFTGKPLAISASGFSSVWVVFGVWIVYNCVAQVNYVSLLDLSTRAPL
jgi:hypothetical protein